MAPPRGSRRLRLPTCALAASYLEEAASAFIVSAVRLSSSPTAILRHIQARPRWQAAITSSNLVSLYQWHCIPPCSPEDTNDREERTSSFIGAPEARRADAQHARPEAIGFLYRPGQELRARTGDGGRDLCRRSASAHGTHLGRSARHRWRHRWPEGIVVPTVAFARVADLPRGILQVSSPRASYAAWRCQQAVGSWPFPPPPLVGAILLRRLGPALGPWKPCYAVHCSEEPNPILRFPIETCINADVPGSGVRGIFGS